MKKFLYPLSLAALLCVFFFSCSNDGFEKPKPDDLASWAGWAGLDIDDTKVKCFVEESCYEISKSACMIIGGEEKPDKECISFTCEWNSNSVEYGQKSILSFKWGNIAQEDCSWKISDGNKSLDTGEYTISRSTFSNLSFSKDTSIVAKATVICGGQTIPQNCKPLAVKSVPINFNCGWTSEEVKYGGKSTLYFAFDPASASIAQKEGCTLKTSPLDTGEHTISASTIAGLSYSKDTTIAAKATVTCGGQVIPAQECKPLAVIHVPGPEKTGTLSFKKSDYKSNDTNYFFIGTKIDTTYINNTIKITNKEESGCGDIKIKIDSLARFGTPVRATAVVTCPHIGELELDGISAEVLPNPVIGDCKLIGDWDAMMFKKDTLFMSVPIENNYGRCKVQNDTLPLKNYSGKVNDITAKIVCGATTTDKKCNEEIFVADKFAEIKECHNPRVQIGPGITIVEITCSDGDTPAKTFGCDCSGGDWSTTNMFTLNGIKAQGGGCWATASIPSDIANKESKRVLIEYNKEIGCVAY
jgi:hypothetical protein